MLRMRPEPKQDSNRGPNASKSGGDGIDHTGQTSYFRSRLQRSRSEATHDIKSWATDGMKGHVLLVRNSGMLVANIIAARALETQLWDLAREKNDCLRARDRDRQLFLNHLRVKGDRYRRMVVEIESRKKVRPNTVHLSVSGRGSLLHRVHEYPRVRRVSRRTTSFVDATEPETLMVHPLPFMSATKEEEARGSAIVDEVLPVAEVETGSHKGGSHSAQPVYSKKNVDHLWTIRSTSSIPATRGRYETCIPVRLPVSKDPVTADFLPSSELLQYTHGPPEDDDDDLNIRPEAERDFRPKSCCVFSEFQRRSMTTPESIHISKLIDGIDSLHVPSRNQKKTKARTDVIMKEIFRI